MTSAVPEWLAPLADTVARAVAEEAELRPGHAVPAGTTARSSAVLVLFGESDTGPDVLLIERAATLSSHAGQPAFPGGGADPGDDGPVDTALREAAEEVGLARGGVSVFAQLPELWVPPSGYVVTPVLAWWHEPSPVAVVDHGEVARVARVPIADLVDPARRLRIRHPSGFVGPAFEVAEMLVWGFTAMVLDWLLDAGGWAVAWDFDDVRDLPPELLPVGPGEPDLLP